MTSTAKTTTALPALTVGDRIGPYEIIAIEASRIAIADHSGDGFISGNRNRNAGRRWYKLTSPTLAAKLARAAR